MQKKLTRSQARNEAFKLVFEVKEHEEELDFLFDNLTEEMPEAMTSMDYIKNVVTGVSAHYDELIEIITANLASGWKINRISKVSRAILLLATFEIKYLSDVPSKVAANEAVELAKKYDEESAASFVNGVLAGIIKNEAAE